MATPIDPLRVYDRGLLNLDDLAGAERLLFMLQDFDNLMEMEGWEHFFRHQQHFAWYAEMKAWLHRIEAASSLSMLAAYESHVRSLGFELSPAGIEALLMSQGDEQVDRNCPDWREKYCDLRDDRWKRAVEFLNREGFSL